MTTPSVACKWHSGDKFRLDKWENATTCEMCRKVAKVMGGKLALLDLTNKERGR